MKNTAKIKKSIVVLSCSIVVSLSIGLLSTVAYAHNTDSTVKAVNMLGYEYVNTTTLKVFFDKGLSSLNQGQFKVETEGGTPITISNMSTSSGSGWTNSQSPGGTTVTLTTGQLSYDTRYKVKVSSTIQMGNSYLLTLGNYLLHNDVEFHFKTPKSDGTYSGTPSLVFLPTSTHAGLSSNVEAISDIPIDTSSFNLSDMKLQKYVGGTYQDVTEDTTLDTNETSGAECYTTQINDAHNCVFLPETLRGGDPSYNLASQQTQYKLVVPDDMKSVNYDGINGKFADDDSQFTTGIDTAASMSTAPSVTGYSASSVSLSWSDITQSDSGTTPNHYHVYYSTNPYFNFVKSTASVNHNGTTNTCTVTGLSGATNYYFRIVPVNDATADEEGGFSPYVSQITS